MILSMNEMLINIDIKIEQHTTKQYYQELKKELFTNKLTNQLAQILCESRHTISYPKYSITSGCHSCDEQYD